MTSQKLFEALQVIIQLDESLKLQTSLSAIRDNLVNLVGQPSAPQFQTALGDALSAFSIGENQLATKLTPSQSATIAELGGAEFFDPSLVDKVREKIERNAMTPSVARDFVQDLTARRATFLQTVRTTLDGLQTLISTETPKEEQVAPGEAAFAIPRDLFDNRLGKLAKELTFISLMMEHMSEAESGEIQPVELEYLSSSIPTVAIAAKLGLLKLLASIINSFLDGWKKVEEIREVRARAKALGMSGPGLEEFTETITTTVEEVVEESTTLALSTYPGESGRKHELENALKADFQRFFGQIERGLTVEIRTHNPTHTGEHDSEESRAIADIAKGLVFPAVSKEPMLLTSSEILEGEISRKTITTRKSTSQKTTTKPGAHSDK